MKINKTLSSLFLFIFLLSQRGFAQDVKQLYSTAVREAESGNRDFAFMHCRELLENYPDSKYASDAAFAIGEYYFITANYEFAAEALSNFINDYPDSKGLPFVLMYLLKVPQIHKNESLTEKLKNQIISLKRLSLLFQESKGYAYTSPLGIKYRMMYYIDKVELYVDDKLFENIPY